MTFLLGILTYFLVLIYGVLLSVSFAGGCTTKKERKIVVIFCLLILFVQTSCFFELGFDITKKLYPIISHLPLVLILTFAFKRPFSVAFTAVMTGYFCCQLPRYFSAVVLFVSGSKTAYQIGYMLSVFVFFFILKRYLSTALYQAMTYSKRTLFLFGLLPFCYYIFDYATTVYTTLLYEGIRAISEFSTSAIALFYVIFITIYHNEVQKRSQLELTTFMLAAQSQQAQNEISTLRLTQQQAATYRHDLRHHITLIHRMLESGQTEKAMEYLAEAEDGVERITPRRFCENETFNLILSSFANKAEQDNIILSIHAELPPELSIADLELCSVLSNGTENALNAVAQITDSSLRRVHLECRVDNNRFLLMIENPYTGEVLMKNSVPVSKHAGHGFGCRSMLAIAEKRKGLCTFKTDGGMFTLRVVLPL